MDTPAALPLAAQARRPRRAPARPRAVVVALGLFLLATVAPARQQPPRIAVVDLDLVFLQSPIGASLQAELKKLEDDTRKRIETELQAIQDLQQRAAAASPEQRLELQRQSEDRELSARRIRDDAARQAQKLEQESRRRFSTTMEPVFQALQQEQGWDLILNKAVGLVIFAGDSIDVTPLVLERLTAGG
ncbi:MAG TPA: OmpH family outer membrane protein [Thermoanaerobaculia bacterium]|nr:OmpH family outer membrane protein [Thermoanaerobaculia bacterium]